MPARPLYDPEWDATLERFTGTALSPNVTIDPKVPHGRNVFARHRGFMGRRLRRTIERMAEHLGVTVNKRWSDFELWGAIYEHTRAGVQRTTDMLAGDPFILALTGYCSTGHAPWKATLIAQRHDGGPIGEKEGKDRLAYMKRTLMPTCDHPMGDGQPCGKPLHSYSSDMTRRSAYEAAERAS